MKLLTIYLLHLNHEFITMILFVNLKNYDIRIKIFFWMCLKSENINHMKGGIKYMIVLNDRARSFCSITKSGVRKS